MATTIALQKLLDKYNAASQEENMLKEDKKQILEEFKNEVNPKVFKLALGVAKKKAKMMPEELDEFDQVLDFLEKNLAIEHIE